MKPPEKPPVPFGAVMVGIAQVARGRAEGLEKFGNTPQAVLAAMTPLMAFVLVGGALALLVGKLDGLATFAAVTVALLGSLVLSFEIARLMGRGGKWLRFAAAFCWCQWATPVVFGGMVVVMSLLIAAGLSDVTAVGIGMVVLVCYGLWLHWFLARHALALSGLRAAMLVFGVNMGTTLLISIPQWADYLMNGPSPP